MQLIQCCWFDVEKNAQEQEPATPVELEGSLSWRLELNAGNSESIETPSVDDKFQ